MAKKLNPVERKKRIRIALAVLGFAVVVVIVKLVFVK